MSTLSGAAIPALTLYARPIQLVLVSHKPPIAYADGSFDGYNAGFTAGQTAGYASGYTAGFAAGVASVPGFTAPQVHVLSTFSADFRTARDQLWQASLPSWPAGGQAIVLVRIAERNEMLVARDAFGVWRWPFDIVPDNAITLPPDVATPGSVQLRPRGGWPPSVVEIQIVAGKAAVEV